MIEPCDYYTWLGFKQSVLALLPLDNSRLIQGDTTDSNGHSVYVGALIRQGVIDVQTQIPAYRKGHETVYYPQDFVTEGAASRGVLPPQAQVQDCWLFKLPDDTIPAAGPRVTIINPDGGFPGEPTNDVPWNPLQQLIRPTSQSISATLTGPLRFPIKQFDWAKRFELVNNMVAVNDNHGRVAIDRYGYTFYVYPEVCNGFLFSLHWDGLKLDFKDSEATPFDEGMVMAVSQFVRGMLARDVEKDLAMYASYFHPATGSYNLTRRNLFIEAQERGRIKQ